MKRLKTWTWAVGKQHDQTRRDGALGCKSRSRTEQAW